MTDIAIKTTQNWPIFQSFRFATISLDPVLTLSIRPVPEFIGRNTSKKFPEFKRLYTWFSDYGRSRLVINQVKSGLIG